MNPALLGMAGSLSWGTLDYISRFPSRQVGHLNTVFAATVVGFVLLTGWMVIGGYAFTAHWPNLWLVALSGIGSALATMWLFAALAIGPISVVSPIAASYPALSVGYAFAMGSRPSALEWIAMAAVMAGVFVVSRVATGTVGSRSNRAGQYRQSRAAGAHVEPRLRDFTDRGPGGGADLRRGSDHMVRASVRCGRPLDVLRKTV